MRLRLQEVVLPLDHAEGDLRQAVATRLRCALEAITALDIHRRNVDARSRRDAPVFVYTVDVELPQAPKTLDARCTVVDTEAETYRVEVAPTGSGRVVVVGAGPAGLFAALTLAEAGCPPLLVERGASLAERQAHVAAFWEQGDLHPQSNVLFGEGGAGLFSDGKLTSRSRDRVRSRHILQTLVACGAPADTMIKAEPHLGSDGVARVVEGLRMRLEQAGVERRYDTRLTGLHVEAGVLRGVDLDGACTDADACVLATGASARDVYALLHASGVALAAKPFAVGVRLEVPQAQIDRAQWGRFASHPRLGAASFRLTRKAGAGARAAYSFCMCPGGSVIRCAAMPDEVATNGMSLSARAGVFGNAAFLVPVEPSDCKTVDAPANALAGMRWQQALERAAFQAGDGGYVLPASRYTDFLAGRGSTGLPDDRSCPQACPANLHEILPAWVNATLVRALPPMLRSLAGVDPGAVLLYAPETRSSSPVRVLRDRDGQSSNVCGLFPAGEGAGYAGGIMSSAVDGVRAAEAVLRALE